MKRWIEKPRFGGMLLAGVTISLVMVHIWMPFASKPWNWVINFLPLVLVTSMVLCRGKKPSVCADTVAILLAAAQGILWGIAAAAALGLSGCSWAPWYHKYPYDQAAFSIILLLCAVLVGVMFIADQIKNDEINSDKRMFLQFCVTFSLALPVIVPALKLMEYFEGILSHFVS